MANHDMTTAANLDKVTHKPKHVFSAYKEIRRVITLADLATIKGSAAAAADTFDLLTIPAGTVVEGVAIRTMVAVAGGSVSSPTIALGDQSAASFQAATAVDGTVNTFTGGSGAYLQNSSSPYQVYGGKFYSTANTLRATLGGTWTGATAGAFEVYLLVMEPGVNVTL